MGLFHKILVSKTITEIPRREGLMVQLELPSGTTSTKNLALFKNREKKRKYRRKKQKRRRKRSQGKRKRRADSREAKEKRRGKVF